MAFSHTMGGTTFTQANFEGNAYSDESTGFPKAMEKMVEHVANAYRGISTTSNAVGAGSKTWTVTNSNSQIPAFAVGMPVRVARTSAPTTTYMQGEVTAFTPATGSTTVNVSSSLGSGTHTDWTITIGGHQTTASASPLAIGDGGTGAGTAGAALTALGGVGAGANSSITSLTGLTTSLTVAQGGTGAATHTANNVLVGAGTSAVTSVAPSTSGNVLTSNGSAWTSAAAASVSNFDGLSLNNAKLQSMVLEIGNVGGTIKHRWLSPNMGVTELGNWGEKFLNATTTNTTTPTGTDSSTAFANGAKLMSSDHNLILLDMAAQTTANALISPVVIFNNNTGTAGLMASPSIQNRNVNGTTRQRWEMGVYDSAEAAFLLNTSNMASGKRIRMLITGWFA